MICDICVEPILQEEEEGQVFYFGGYHIEGHTVCTQCVVNALVFYCKYHKKSVAVSEPSESVKEAWKEDNTRGWWA